MTTYLSCPVIINYCVDLLAARGYIHPSGIFHSQLKKETFPLLQRKGMKIQTALPAGTVALYIGQPPAFTHPRNRVRIRNLASNTPFSPFFFFL